MSDRRKLRAMLSKAAKAIRCPAARQRFREFLAEMDDDEPRARKVHSWKRKSKPPAKKRRPKQFAFSAKKSQQGDLFEIPAADRPAADTGTTRPEGNDDEKQS